jgi:hypothetical protein
MEPVSSVQFLSLLSMLLQTQVTVTDVDSRRTVTPAVTADGEEK